MHDAIALFAAPRDDSPARLRIRRLSLPFQGLFLTLAALTAMVMVLLLVFAVAPGFGSIWIGPEGSWLILARDLPPKGTIAFNALPPSTQLTAGLAFGLIGGSLIAAFTWLSALFGAYRRGDVFGPVPQAHMTRSALCLIVFALAPGLLQPLLALVESPDRAWFHGHSLAALMVGAVLLVLARVMALGREVEQDARSFI